MEHDEFPELLQRFIATVAWTFAKTMPEWPHEYIVRGRVDERLFVALVEHIRTQGYDGKFYRKEIRYFDHAGRVYWTMGAPIAETTIVNRCYADQSYESRLRNGTLPPTRTGRILD